MFTRGKKANDQYIGSPQDQFFTNILFSLFSHVFLIKLTIEKTLEDKVTFFPNLLPLFFYHFFSFSEPVRHMVGSYCHLIFLFLEKTCLVT